MITNLGYHIYDQNESSGFNYGSGSGSLISPFVICSCLEQVFHNISFSLLWPIKFTITLLSQYQ